MRYVVGNGTRWKSFILSLNCSGYLIAGLEKALTVSAVINAKAVGEGAMGRDFRVARRTRKCIWQQEGIDCCRVRQWLVVDKRSELRLRIDLSHVVVKTEVVL